MSAETDFPEPQMKRSVGSRIGLVLLNILGPGLGVLRVGSLRAATILLAVPLLSFFVALVLFRILPDLDFAGFIAIATGLLGVTLLNLVVALVLTWRGSRISRASPPMHARWPVVIGVMVAGYAVWFAITADRDMLGYRTFYVPSQAMAPTLLPQDTFVARMRVPEPLLRGQIILHDARGAIFIQRVAGLPGDRIAMRDGRIVLNGSEIAQIPTGLEGLDPVNGATLREFREQLPDEVRPHRIYDSGMMPIADDHDEVVVPAGHIFLLGDNRDNSADSRFSGEQFGVGFVPMTAIKGYPLFHLWPGGSQPSGTPVHD